MTPEPQTPTNRPRGAPRERAARSATRVERHAHLFWVEHANRGSGRVGGASGALRAVPVSLVDEVDRKHAATTPGELLAAAHSASFAAALAELLADRGTPARELIIDATCELGCDRVGRRVFTALRLQVRGRAHGLDAAAFRECAEATLSSCSVSQAVSPGVPIALDVHFIEDA